VCSPLAHLRLSPLRYYKSRNIQQLSKRRKSLNSFVDKWVGGEGDGGNTKEFINEQFNLCQLGFNKLAPMTLALTITFIPALLKFVNPDVYPTSIMTGGQSVAKNVDDALTMVILFLAHFFICQVRK
jgi:hypothetical protein